MLNKNCSRRHFKFLLFIFLKKIRLDFHVNPLPRSSLILFGKKNEEIFMNVVCCSRDWRFKGNANFSVAYMQSYHSLNSNHVLS